MNLSPHKRLLGNKFLSFAKSRLPVPNKPKTRIHHRRTLVAPVPFAPIVDTHAFQPPPPYSVRADDSVEFLPVPHNTPEESARGLAPSTSMGSYGIAVGLGLQGVENGDGGRFDGLGRLSGGFKASDGLVHHAQRRRTWTRERPTTRYDVFYPSGETCERVVETRTVKGRRTRRKSVASPTPGPRRWENVRRGTVSSELKRAASVERRASLSETTNASWRR